MIKEKRMSSVTVALKPHFDPHFLFTSNCDNKIPVINAIHYITWDTWYIYIFVPFCSRCIIYFLVINPLHVPSSAELSMSSNRRTKDAFPTALWPNLRLEQITKMQIKVHIGVDILRVFQQQWCCQCCVITALAAVLHVVADKKNKQ